MCDAAHTDGVRCVQLLAQSKLKGQHPMSTKAQAIKENSSSVLASLGVGSIIYLTQGNFYATVVTILDGESAVAMNTLGEGANTTFVITMYEFNGSNEAKISLQENATGASKAYWVPGNSTSGLTTPILLGSEPGQFLLTDTGDGVISIQNTFSPPSPYIQNGVANILSYGFDQPSTQGFFNIGIAG